MSTQSAELKSIDAPIEVLLFDPLTRWPARWLAPRVSPLTITLLAFLFRCGGAALVVGGAYTWATVPLFLGFVLDAVDGKVARIRGDQVGIHGTADFLLDQVALVIVLSTFFLCPDASSSLELATLAFLGIYLVYTAIGGTRLRILGDLGIDWRTPGSLRQAYAKFGLDEPRKGFIDRVVLVYVSLQQRARRRRILLRPTGIEAQFVLLIVTPLAAMSWWPVVVATILLIPDMAAMGIATLRLALIEDASRRRD